MIYTLVNGLTRKERRDLEEPEDLSQLSPLYDREELAEMAEFLGVQVVI